MAANWIKNYLQASFRDVEFFIQSHDLDIGRRQAIHEFPNVNEPYAEDLGRKARVFSLDAYIIGDNYFDHRNKLIAAIEQAGPGKLVHPYLGTFQVVVTGSVLRESTTEGRVARFSLTFQEQKEISLTTSVTNTADQNFQVRSQMLVATGDYMEENYDINKVAVGILQDILNSINAVSDMLLRVKQTVAVVSEFRRELSNIKGKGIQLVLDVNDLVESFNDVVTFGSDIFSNQNAPSQNNARRQYFEMLTALGNQRSFFGPGITNPNSVFNSMIYLQSIATAGGLLSIVPFTSKEDAENLFNLINAELDNVENTDGINDSLLESVRDLRSSILQDIEQRTANLGEIYEYKITEQSRPTIAVSNSIYGSINQEQEIIDRNGIQNPFFATGTLSVVINEQ